MMSGRKMRQLVGVLGSALLISACGSSDSDGEAATHNEPSPTQAAEPMPVQDSAFGEMVGTMDRARGVESTQMERKEAVDRAIEQNTGGAPAE